MTKRKHVELFAGCGGMALGMKAANFKLVFANEVSPMASNTFAHNILNENIEVPSSNIKWLHSRYNRENYDKRLRENLLDHSLLENCELEFRNDLTDLSDCLVVGDIRHLLSQLKKHKISDPYNGQLDLVSGGPPCQSFSLAGKREYHNYKNRLPLDFAEVCQILQPKVVLLENVKGILSGFQDGNKKRYAWIEVAKAFAINGYAPFCMLINSKYFGIAQNRPRYLMIAYRYDQFLELNKVYRGNKIIKKVNSFYTKCTLNVDSVAVKDLDYYDIEKEPELFNGRILPKASTLNKEKWITVSDAIDDLIHIGPHTKSNYVNRINKLFSTNSHKSRYIYNHHFRNHTTTIKNRFLFYQLINHINGRKDQLIKELKEGKQPSEFQLREMYSDLSVKIERFSKLFDKYFEFKKFINNTTLTKKHSQRALVKTLPSPAQLTIPDDTCHYSPFENRVLTVREIARIQSFPDSFLFKSKETTGGSNRSYEVPQYTQVGNAVPPLLAYAVGQFIKSVLTKIEKNVL